MSHTPTHEPGAHAIWEREATSCAELQRSAAAAVEEAKVLGSKQGFKMPVHNMYLFKT